MSEEELVEIMLSNGTIVDNCLIYGDLTLGLIYGGNTLILRGISGTEITITDGRLRDRFCFLIARKRKEKNKKALEELYASLPASLQPVEVAEHVALEGEVVKRGYGLHIRYGNLHLTMEGGRLCLVVLKKEGIKKYPILSDIIKRAMEHRRTEEVEMQEKMEIHSDELIEEADL